MAMYVTFYWAELNGRSTTKAIQCKNEKQVEEVFFDISSLYCIRNVRVNRCGKLRKNIQCISFEDYKSGKWYKM